MTVFESSDEDLCSPNSYYNSFEEMYELSLEDLEFMLEQERPYAVARLKKACERARVVDYRLSRKTNKSTRKHNDHEVLQALSNADTSMGYALQEWNRLCLMERVITRKQGEAKKAKVAARAS
jgi:predicted nucleic acid-binding OB-fold protein